MNLLNGLYEEGVVRCTICKHYEGNMLRGHCNKHNCDVGQVNGSRLFSHMMACTSGEAREGEDDGQKSVD